MPGFTPSLDAGQARHHLRQLIRADMDASSFQSDIQRLARLYSAFAASCPPPWPAPGLALTPEIHYQSELWLPLAQIRPAFHRLYRKALCHAPVLSSSPFADATSWAAITRSCPPIGNLSPNPALLLEQLLADADQRLKFLLWSFLPARFYGSGCQRYPAQAAFIDGWLTGRTPLSRRLRCLDAACGDGAGTYGLARLLLGHGVSPDRFRIQGWTIDPLEVWAAAHACFPHDPARQGLFRSWTAPVFDRGAESSILFRAENLLGEGAGGGGSRGGSPVSEPQPADPAVRPDEGSFDLILCNGLLGGPIVNQRTELGLVVGNLAALLRPDGMLLAADHFHGGWKKNIPKETLGDAFRACGLVVADAGEGIGGLKPDQQAAP